jgi:hypothetical protein
MDLSRAVNYPATQWPEVSDNVPCETPTLSSIFGESICTVWNRTLTSSRYLYYPRCRVQVLSKQVNLYERYAIACCLEATLTHARCGALTSQGGPGNLWEEMEHEQQQPSLWARRPRNTVNSCSNSPLVRVLLDLGWALYVTARSETD